MLGSIDEEAELGERIPGFGGDGVWIGGLCVSETGAEGTVVMDGSVVRSIRVGWAVRDVVVMRMGCIFHLAAFPGGLLRWLFFWRGCWISLRFWG
jgi:hypothetical protein